MKQLFNVKELENILHVKFKNKNLLITAFTHSSFANENQVESNERLEFLGDSVLGLIVTEQIYKTTNLNEGNLSKLRALLVSVEPLSKVVDSLNIVQFLIKGKGESKNKSTSAATKCDLFEAIVGALYLDGGFIKAEAFVLNALKPLINQVLNLTDYVDAKSKLQETFAHDQIEYQTVAIGTEAKPEFKSIVFINNIASGEGCGSSKRNAEQMAANTALKNIKEV